MSIDLNTLCEMMRCFSDDSVVLPITKLSSLLGGNTSSLAEKRQLVLTYMNFLLAEGAIFNQDVRWGSMVLLDQLLQHGDLALEIVRILVAYGVPVHGITDQGWNAIQCAMWSKTLSGE